jgi:predicted enzyme related to lactoylglutathione lyase
VCDPGITHLCFDVVDLDWEYERLSNAGMTFHCSPQDVAAGIRTTYGRDPDGNVVELQEVASAEYRIALPPIA